MQKQVLYLLVIAFAIGSCCSNDLIDTISFTPEELTANAYEGIEQPEFVNDSGDVMSFQPSVHEIVTDDLYECDGGCCDYYNVEILYHTVFVSSYMNATLNVDVASRFDRFSGNTHPASFYLHWQYEETGSKHSSVSSSLPVDEMLAATPDNSYFKQSLELRGAVYSDVYVLEAEAADSQLLHVKKFYYTLNEGVIGMSMSDGQLWVLK